MKYEKPEIVDFGSIAQHTYNGGRDHFFSWFKCWGGASGDRPHWPNDTEA
ncbi:MAG: hypothetical protein ACXW15_04880 [Acidimicrobiia bacterium]